MHAVAVRCIAIGVVKLQQKRWQRVVATCTGNIDSLVRIATLRPSALISTIARAARRVERTMMQDKMCGGDPWVFVRFGVGGLSLLLSGCSDDTAISPLAEAQEAVLVHCPAGEAPSCTIIKGKNVCVCEPIDLPPPATVLGVVTGPSRHFAWKSNGLAYAWGDAGIGSGYPSYFGDGGFSSNTPRNIATLSDVAEIDTASDLACARSNAGTVYCWGDFGTASVGGAMIHTETPLRISGLAAVVQIAVGEDHACALRSDGTVWCWGDGYWGQRGGGSDSSSPTTPNAVVGLSDAVQIGAGALSSCALRAGGSVVCWGSNTWGALGNGSPSTTIATTPVTALLPVQAVTLTHRSGAVLVTTSDGSVYGWGANGSSEYGDGTGPVRLVPTLAPALHGARSFAIGTGGSPGTPPTGSHCAIFSDGATRCWGSNKFGQLADGTTSDHLSPGLTVGLTNLSRLANPGESLCGVNTAGELYCWGANFFGELGTGEVGGGSVSLPHSVPLRVLL